MNIKKKQYCAGGSLADLLYNMSHNHRKLSEPIVGYIVRELINALSYLHMNHIMHRDIKAANILLTADGQIKITDFGFARWFIVALFILHLLFIRFIYSLFH